jgi:hypothetical protein
MANYVIEGVDENDGNRTVLHECETSSDARRWLNGYTRRNDGETAGGWHLIEVYDVRGGDAERVFWWEAGATFLA